ncbi:hypothetical protein Bca101_081767 [Brassica carinata]
MAMNFVRSTGKSLISTRKVSDLYQKISISLYFNLFLLFRDQILRFCFFFVIVDQIFLSFLEHCYVGDLKSGFEDQFWSSNQTVNQDYL